MELKKLVGQGARLVRLDVADELLHLRQGLHCREKASGGIWVPGNQVLEAQHVDESNDGGRVWGGRHARASYPGKSRRRLVVIENDPIVDEAIHGQAAARLDAVTAEPTASKKTGTVSTSQAVAPTESTVRI
jgi:hypothetical protein